MKKTLPYILLLAVVVGVAFYLGKTTYDQGYSLGYKQGGSDALIMQDCAIQQIALGEDKGMETEHCKEATELLKTDRVKDFLANE